MPCELVCNVLPKGPGLAQELLVLLLAGPASLQSDNLWEDTCCAQNVCYNRLDTDEVSSHIANCEVYFDLQICDVAHISVAILQYRVICDECLCCNPVLQFLCQIISKHKYPITQSVTQMSQGTSQRL